MATHILAPPHTLPNTVTSILSIFTCLHATLQIAQHWQLHNLCKLHQAQCIQALPATEPQLIRMVRAEQWLNQVIQVGMVQPLPVTHGTPRSWTQQTDTLIYRRPCTVCLYRSVELAKLTPSPVPPYNATKAAAQRSSLCDQHHHTAVCPR